MSVGTWLNNLGPQSNVLMTEAVFIWTSFVLSTSCILIFTAILHLEQNVSRWDQDPVVAGPQTYSIVTARNGLPQTQPSLVRKVSVTLWRGVQGLGTFPKQLGTSQTRLYASEGQISAFSTGNSSSLEWQRQILQSCSKIFFGFWLIGRIALLVATQQESKHCKWAVLHHFRSFNILVVVSVGNRKSQKYWK